MHCQCIIFDMIQSPDSINSILEHFPNYGIAMKFLYIFAPKKIIFEYLTSKANKALKTQLPLYSADVTQFYNYALKYYNSDQFGVYYTITTLFGEFHDFNNNESKYLNILECEQLLEHYVHGTHHGISLIATGICGGEFVTHYENGKIIASESIPGIQKFDDWAGCPEYKVYFNTQGEPITIKIYTQCYSSLSNALRRHNHPLAEIANKVHQQDKFLQYHMLLGKDDFSIDLYTHDYPEYDEYYGLSGHIGIINKEELQHPKYANYIELLKKGKEISYYDLTKLYTNINN